MASRPALTATRATGRSTWLRTSSGRGAVVGFAPILDTERGVVGGVAAIPSRGRTLDADQLAQVLVARERLPRNTFMSVGLDWTGLRDPAIRAELLRPGDLHGVVFELVGVVPGAREPGLSAVAASIQDAGGMLAVQADEIWHPDFTAITETPPRLIIVGEKWVRGIETSERRQAIVATLGSVAAERDAWVLAAGVSSRDELTTLATLHVPLMMGRTIGVEDFADWPVLAHGVTAALGPQQQRDPGPMRDMLISVPTVRTIGDAKAAVERSAGPPAAAVVLDAYGRPVGLAVRTVGGVRSTEDVLCVHVDTAVLDASARARARSIKNDPILAVDSAGRFLGLVTVDSLAQAC